MTVTLPYHAIIPQHQERLDVVQQPQQSQEQSEGINESRKKPDPEPELQPLKTVTTFDDNDDSAWWTSKDEVAYTQEPLKFDYANDEEGEAVAAARVVEDDSSSSGSDDDDSIQEQSCQPTRKRKATSLASNNRTKKTKCKNRHCVFVETVRVVPIPTRHTYDSTMKSQLWSTSLEIQENAHRNTIEFASEGWDWRKVLDEDQLIVNSNSSNTEERVHPVHYEPQAVVFDGNSSSSDDDNDDDDDEASVVSDIEADVIATALDDDEGIAAAAAVDEQQQEPAETTDEEKSNEERLLFSLLREECSSDDDEDEFCFF